MGRIVNVCSHAALTVLIWWFISPADVAAAARQCVAYDKIEEEFAVSNGVFSGRVVHIESLRSAQEQVRSGLAHHIVTSIATIEPERSWKGPRDRRVRVGAARKKRD